MANPDMYGQNVMRSGLNKVDENPNAQENRWISVEDRLPEEGQPVWMWTPKFKRQYTVVAPLKPDVTHWMPLPDPPNNN